MPSPQLFFGTEGAALLQADSGYLDDTDRYDLYFRTPRVARAGTGGELAFYTMYVTTTHYDADVRLYLTPYVDGTSLGERVIQLVGVPGSEGETRVHELSLLVPYLREGVERLRHARRGAWFHVVGRTRYADLALNAGRQVVDLIEVEAEVLREGLRSGEARA